MKRTEYKGANLKEISFPLGGIGTGCIGLFGNGRLADYEIFNRPNRDTNNNDSCFAVSTIKNGKIVDTRIIQGDCEKNLNGTVRRGYGGGLEACTMAGFPHFKNVKFTGEFPIAKVDFSDERFLGKISLTAWSPFIPMNDKDSSIPVAFLEYTVTNTTDSELEYNIIGAQRNPFWDSVNTYVKGKGYSAIKLSCHGIPEDDFGYGDMTFAIDSTEGVSYSAYADRFDTRARFWKAISTQTKLKSIKYDNPGRTDLCYLASKVKVAPGESKKVRFSITWSVPNNHCSWRPYVVDGKEVGWKNYYATLFCDSLDSADYCMKNAERMRAGTMLFHDELFGMSLDETVREAVASTLSVLRSPTIMRLENGGIWGWEGLGAVQGYCEGTCTHVYTYAYALCYLFPALERSIRELDYQYNLEPSGKIFFRQSLPLGRPHEYELHACVDGQMGGVIKTYREWKMCGDKDWLLSVWDGVKSSLKYAWSEENVDKWDPNHDGVLEGRQHHTLDVELFGPSSWLEGFYALALKCASEMAEYLGETDFAAECLDLYNKAKDFLNKELFNGKWYCQKIDVNDTKMLREYGDQAYEMYFDPESKQVRYQIGEGCIIDSTLAEWHARLNGEKGIFDEKQLRTSLKNTFKNNFLPSMREHVNFCRIYAVNDEAGMVICTYPKGTPKPEVPILYSTESMHGFEYAFAGLLVTEGMTDEALSIVKAIRDKYRGNNRNPFDEMECGASYARSMAAFALVPLYSGYTVDNVKGEMTFNPVENGKFRSLWFMGDSWGRYERGDKKTTLTVLKDSIKLKKLALPYFRKVAKVTVDGRAVPFTFNKGVITLDVTAEKKITIE